MITDAETAQRVNRLTFERRGAHRCGPGWSRRSWREVPGLSAIISVHDRDVYFRVHGAGGVYVSPIGQCSGTSPRSTPKSDCVTIATRAHDKTKKQKATSSAEWLVAVSFASQPLQPALKAYSMRRLSTMLKSRFNSSSSCTRCCGRSYPPFAPICSPNVPRSLLGSISFLMCFESDSWLKKKHATVTSASPTNCQQKGESQGEASASPSIQGSRSTPGETTHSNRSLASTSESSALPTFQERIYATNKKHTIGTKRNHSFQKKHNMSNKTERHTRAGSTPVTDLSR